MVRSPKVCHRMPRPYGPRSGARAERDSLVPAVPAAQAWSPSELRGVRVQCWTDLADVPNGYGPSVVTIGNFDGVHRGHVGVLTRMVADAGAAGARAVAVTFSPHPSQVHRPQSAPPLLTGDADRLELLAQTGLDAVLLLEYTLDFARQTAEEFVVRYLVEGLAARTVVVGATYGSVATTPVT